MKIKFRLPAALTAQVFQAAQIAFDPGTEVSFNRSFEELQADERARLVPALPHMFADGFDLPLITSANVSAQFLNVGEDVSKENRELLLRVYHDDHIDFIIIAQDGRYLSFASGSLDATLSILNADIGGYKILAVNMPEHGVRDLYGYYSELDLYGFGVTEPLPALAA